VRCFVNIVTFLWRGVVSTSPNPQAKRPPLVGRPRLLVQYIRSYPPYVEAVPLVLKLGHPRRGDRGTLNMGTLLTLNSIYVVLTHTVRVHQQ
jgi:hypothetical protein